MLFILFLSPFYSLFFSLQFPFFYIPCLSSPGAKPPSFHLPTQNHIAFSFIALHFFPKVQAPQVFL